MPKDIKEESKEPKKKMVVIEEVVEESPIEKEKEVSSAVTEVIADKEEVSSTQSAVTEVVTDEEEVEKSNYLWIIIPTALLIGALVGGLITYFSGLSKLSVVNSTPIPVASPIVPVVIPTSTPIPKSDIDRSAIKLQVLNGSGVSGLAGKAKAYLETLGYKDVVAGNASISNVTETMISLKADKKDLLEQLTADLSKNYKVAEKTETLSASSKYDFVITLGSK